METPQIDGISALGCSVAQKIPYGTLEHTFEAWIEHIEAEASKITAVTIKVQGSLEDDGSNGVVTTPGGAALAIGSTAENIANGLFNYRIADTDYSKAAVAAGTAPSSAHTIANTKYGFMNLYIDTDGTIITLTDKLGNDQTALQSYADYAAAVTASNLIPLPSGYAYIGRVLLYNNEGAQWDAATDDLTDGSDITNASFYSAGSQFVDIVTHTFTADELTQQRASFTLSDTYYPYMRFFLSTLTGTGKFSARHIPIKPKVRA